MLGALSGPRSCNDTPAKMVQRMEDPASVSVSTGGFCHFSTALPYAIHSRVVRIGI